MYRTVFGDLQQTAPLLFRELAGEGDRHIDLIDAVEPRMLERHSDRPQRPLLARGVYAYGHRLACAQCREQELGRVGSRIRAAGIGGLVGLESVRTDGFVWT